MRHFYFESVGGICVIMHYLSGGGTIFGRGLYLRFDALDI